MAILIKILSIITFAWVILFALCFVSKIFTLFLVPIFFFTFVFFSITVILGLFYYWGNNPLFYSHLTLIFLAVASYFLPFLLSLFVSESLMQSITDGFIVWIGRIWAFILPVFYGLIVFKKLWIL